MRRIGRVLTIAFFSVLAVVAALAMLDNREPIALHFLGYSSPELSVYWWLIAAFVVGVSIGWLGGSVGTLRARSSERKATRALAKHESERDRESAPQSADSAP